MTLNDNAKIALYVIGGLVLLSTVVYLLKSRKRPAVVVGTGAAPVPDKIAAAVAAAVGTSQLPTVSSAPPANGL